MAIANGEYHGSLVIGSPNIISLLTLDCEPYYSINNNAIYHLQSIKIHGEYLIVMGDYNIRVYKGDVLHYRYRREDVLPLEIIPLFPGNFIMITKNSHFILF